MRFFAVLLFSVTVAIAEQRLDAERDLLLVDDRADHSAFDHILKDVVHGNDGLVDYDKMRSDHADELRAYLDRMSRVESGVLSREAQLAYYINLYNATMIQAVIDRRQDGDDDYSPAADDFAVFKDKLVRLPDRKLSLNELENDVIRKEFNDPRVHVGLACAARSCPPLLPRAYQAEDLDQVLDENMRRFVNDPLRNPIDHAAKQAKLSKIFDWYPEDFGGRDEKLIEYLNRYSEKDLTGYDVSFVEYSWELNELEK